MNDKFSRILDESTERLIKGENIESCLEEYPNDREQLEPLLNTAQLLSSIPRISVSEKYRQVSKARLIARIRRESTQVREAETRPGMGLFDELGLAWHRMWQGILGAKKVAIPVTLASILALVLSVSGLFNYLSTTPALASQCTLTILSGNVDVQMPGSTAGKTGTDGMTLNIGTRVKTAPDSHAVLTFFEGSTVKLEPDTEIEIQQIEYDNEQPTAIVLKQWLGRTWSRVVKMADPGSHYQIETPSATAIVRGTLFTTDVEATGATKVTTTEGLVSVVAQGDEVYLPASQQTKVDAGEVPSQPQPVPVSKSEIIITFDMPAFGSVTDPTGSSTGILPSGFSFNQILKSQSFLTAEATQLINITEPVTGEYIIALRYLSEGQAHFNILGTSDGNVVFDYSGNWGAFGEKGWLIHLTIHAEGGRIISGEVTSAEQLGEETPEEIVEAPLAGGKASTTTTQDSNTNGTTDIDKGKPEDKGPPEDKGKPDKPEDKDDTGNKGKPNKPEDGDDTGNKGKPEDKDKPDKPEDKDNTGNKGKPEDRGGPEDKGKPDKPEDENDTGNKGKPEDKGKPDKPEDKGPPEGKGKPEDQGPPEGKGKPPYLFS